MSRGRANIIGLSRVVTGYGLNSVPRERVEGGQRVPSLRESTGAAMGNAECVRREGVMH